MVSINFPLQLPYIWQQDISAIPEKYHQQISYSRSLTSRLRTQCRKFNLTVLHEVFCTPELKRFTRAEVIPQAGLIRETILYCDGCPKVYAQSFFPATALDGGFSELNNLGTTPIGDIIFKYPNLQRTSFEFINFKPNEQWQNFLQKLSISRKQLIGRRSSFSLAKERLFLIEVFLT